MVIELFRDVSLLEDVQVCVVGKVFKPNRLKFLALKRTLNEYDSRLHL
jgi:hypothetical protein